MHGIGVSLEKQRLTVGSLIRSLKFMMKPRLAQSA
jgi:hypothetical protein